MEQNVQIIEKKPKNPESAKLISVYSKPESKSTMVRSAMCDAMETSLLQIECSYTRGFSGLQLIGNTSEVCRDGKERVKAALEHSGLTIPAKRVVVSLTPADTKKDGSHFDLPIAMSLSLLIVNRKPCIDPERWLFAAEVGLSGELRPVKGIVSFVIAAIADGLEGVVVCAENLSEIEVLGGLKIAGDKQIKALGFSHLSDVMAWMFAGRLDRAQIVLSKSPQEIDFGEARIEPNFDDMILHPTLEKAAMVVGTGLHSMLLRGSPGTGKSMLAARLTSILPHMGRDEHVESMKINSSYMERLPRSLLAGRPPYRAPHHQASASAVLGTPDAPGELSLSHGGLLFLDELPEFRRDLLEALREPLEMGEVRVSRAKKKVIWKSKVILISACNNCHCGWFGSPRRQCRCSLQKLRAHQEKISGPILDRIDLHVNMPEPDDESADLFVRLSQGGLQSQTVRMAERVKAARKFGAERNQTFGVELNRDLQANHLLAASGLSSSEFSALVNKEIPQTASSRAVMKCIRVARTLADLEGVKKLEHAHLKQAWTWQADKAAEDRGEQIFST